MAERPDASELYREGRRLAEQNQFEAAAVAFQRSVEIDPHFKTLELLGETLIRLNRFRDAIIPLAAAATLNKGCRAASLLSEAFLGLGDTLRAKEIAEIALARDPNNKRALVVMRRASGQDL